MVSITDSLPGDDFVSFSVELVPDPFDPTRRPPDDLAEELKRLIESTSLRPIVIFWLTLGCLRVSSSLNVVCACTADVLQMSKANGMEAWCWSTRIRCTA